MIDIKQLRELVKLMVNNDLTELDVQDKQERVTLKRGHGEPVVQYLPQAHAHAAPAAPAPAAAAPAASTAAASSSSDSGLAAIESPMVGTYYAASSPDAAALVNVGDRVGPDTVVCIIEAMKVFNEIKAEVSGVVERVLVQNGQAVEFGQPMIMVRPA
jgi:acetyl-CoA carboxylase biotin carboxyl carrier protein